jgi:hypothetical protein
MDYEQFVQNLLSIITKNGYPTKKVALPLEKMYETAHKKQLNFNKVLDMLKDRGVFHEKTNERVIFFPQEVAPPSPSSDSHSMAGMMAQAMEMLQKLTPEQRKELEEKVLNMSDEEKAIMMQKAKEMGFGF